LGTVIEMKSPKKNHKNSKSPTRSGKIRVSFRCPEELLAAVRLRAEEEGIALSQWVRRAVRGNLRDGKDGK
jgi:predicted HicB family RNase H-like nuclease